jgi:hypothetical protein
LAGHPQAFLIGTSPQNSIEDLKLKLPFFSPAGGKEISGKNTYQAYGRCVNIMSFSQEIHDSDDYRLFVMKYYPWNLEDLTKKFLAH